LVPCETNEILANAVKMINVLLNCSAG